MMLEGIEWDSEGWGEGRTFGHGQWWCCECARWARFGWFDCCDVAKGLLLCYVGELRLSG